MTSRWLTVMVILGIIATPAAGDIVWRVHCDFPGKGKQPTQNAHDTAADCRRTLATLAALDQDQCRAGDQKACDRFKRTMDCECEPERVE